MNRTCCFFGHRIVLNVDKVKKDLLNIVEKLIEVGYSRFIVGNRGEFDCIVLKVCNELKKTYDIEIYVVFSNERSFFNKENFNNQKYNDCYLIMYEIEEVFYKNKIAFTNKKIVDDSDLVVCYVDMNREYSGAKNIIKYAIKKKKNVVNIYNQII